MGRRARAIEGEEVSSTPTTLQEKQRELERTLEEIKANKLKAKLLREGIAEGRRGEQAKRASLLGVMLMSDKSDAGRAMAAAYIERIQIPEDRALFGLPPRELGLIGAAAPAASRSSTPPTLQPPIDPGELADDGIPPSPVSGHTTAEDGHARGSSEVAQEAQTSQPSSTGIPLPRTHRGGRASETIARDPSSPDIGHADREQDMDRRDGTPLATGAEDFDGVAQTGPGQADPVPQSADEVVLSPSGGDLDDTSRSDAAAPVEMPSGTGGPQTVGDTATIVGSRDAGEDEVPRVTQADGAVAGSITPEIDASQLPSPDTTEVQIGPRDDGGVVRDGSSNCDAILGVQSMSVDVGGAPDSALPEDDVVEPRMPVAFIPRILLSTFQLKDQIKARGFKLDRRGDKIWTVTASTPEQLAALEALRLKPYTPA